MLIDSDRPIPGPAPLRFGLAGTGHWASLVHAPALASAEGIELAAVWGRNAEATATLAARHGARPFADFEAFLANVDAVCFAVPPDVQAGLAARSASAGKHLLVLHHEDGTSSTVTVTLRAGGSTCSCGASPAGRTRPARHTSHSRPCGWH